MAILTSSIAIISFCLAIFLAILSLKVKRLSFIPFLSVFIACIGILLSLIAGATLQEILIIIFILLIVSILVLNSNKDGENEF